MPFLLFLSAALCSSTAFLSHQSDFRPGAIDQMLLVCDILWWACSLLLIRVCSSWSLVSNQSWCFLSGLPKYVLAVFYLTCCRVAHSLSGVERSFFSHWARALPISCSKLFLCLMVISFAVLYFVCLRVLCLLYLCRILKTIFGISI